MAETAASRPRVSKEEELTDEDLLGEATLAKLTTSPEADEEDTQDLDNDVDKE